MARPTVSKRKPSAAASEAEDRPKKTLDDLEMKTITSAIRRDMWRELNKYAADEECSIQVALNRAVYAFLAAQHRPLPTPFDPS